MRRPAGRRYNKRGPCGSNAIRGKGGAVGTSGNPRPEVTYRGVVYPWHVDHMGHMNVQYYVHFFDEASWAFFSNVGMTREYFEGQDRGMAAVEQHLEYLREVFAGTVLTIETVVLQLSAQSVRFRHGMCVGKDVAARCELVGVHISRSARHAVPFPDPIAAALKARIPERETPPPEIAVGRPS